MAFKWVLVYSNRLGSSNSRLGIRRRCQPREPSSGALANDIVEFRLLELRLRERGSRAGDAGEGRHVVLIQCGLQTESETAGGSIEKQIP